MSKTSEVELLTVQEFAIREGVSVGRVRQWITEQRIKVLDVFPYKIPATETRPASQKRGPKPGVKRENNRGPKAGRKAKKA